MGFPVGSHPSCARKQGAWPQHPGNAAAEITVPAARDSQGQDGALRATQAAGAEEIPRQEGYGS